MVTGTWVRRQALVLSCTIHCALNCKIAIIIHSDKLLFWFPYLGRPCHYSLSPNLSLILITPTALCYPLCLPLPCIYNVDYIHFPFLVCFGVWYCIRLHLFAIFYQPFSANLYLNFWVLDPVPMCNLGSLFSHRLAFVPCTPISITS